MKFGLIVLVAISLISLSKSDLPIHCLTSQVKGPWKFYFSESQKDISPIDNNCGHQIPDSEKTSLLSLNKYKFGNDIERLHINLNHDGSVTLVENHPPARFASSESLKGFWTMIYDEGFEVRKGDINMFLFSKYYPEKSNTSQFETNCAKTLTGWFRNKKTKEYGCVKGERTDTEAIINKQLGKTYVVEGKVEDRKVFSDDGNDKKFLAISNLFRFAGTFKTRVQLDASFTDHELMAQRINSMNLGWVAGVNDVFRGLNVSKINQLMGRSRVHKSTKILEPRFLENSPTPHSDPQNGKTELPEKFSWEESLPEPVSQGECGSCFAIAAMQMVSSRVKVKFNRTVNLSPQFVMDCSYYNQGCDGGYPYLVGRFGKEMHFVEEKCKPYLKVDGKCKDTCDYSKAEFLVKAKEYRYVGGRYGMTDEKSILNEVYEHGPIVVDFTPDYAFSLYKDGIYKSTDNHKLFMVAEKRPEWTQVDHAVLLYGWGVTDKGEKYWLLQNSWGKDWGKKGRFKMARGTNDMGIESSGEAIDPDLVAGESVYNESQKLTKLRKSS